MCSVPVLADKRSWGAYPERANSYFVGRSMTMKKEALIRNARNGAAAAAAMVREVACVLCIGSLLALSACTGSTQKASTIDPNVRVDPGSTARFPSNAQLRSTTVSLRMVGFTFGSGVTLNNQGEPTGNGVELVPHQWCGSGFVIGKDGTIVTNYHVARRALRGSPFNMCCEVATSRLYAVGLTNCRKASGANMTVMRRRSGCSSSNSDIERGGSEGLLNA